MIDYSCWASQTIRSPMPRELIVWQYYQLNHSSLQKHVIYILFYKENKQLTKPACFSTLLVYNIVCCMASVSSNVLTATMISIPTTWKKEIYIFYIYLFFQFFVWIVDYFSVHLTETVKSVVDNYKNDTKKDLIHIIIFHLQINLGINHITSYTIVSFYSYSLFIWQKHMVLYISIIELL